MTITYEMKMMRKKKDISNNTRNLNNDGRKVIYINCTNLHNQLRVDGIYYYNFEVYIYLVWTMALMIVFINGLCLIAMVKRKVLSKPSDILLKCMVICDLLMGMFPIPSWSISLILTYHFYPNCALYKFTVFSGYFIAWLNYLIITFITIDRYMSICKPYCYVKWSGNQYMHKVVLVFVFMSSLIAVSSMFLFGNFTLIATVLCFVILVILIGNTMLYVKISQSIKSIDNYYKNLVGKQFATSKVTSFEKKGQFKNLMMLLTLAFSYCPYFLSQVVHFFGALEDDLGYALGIWGYAFIFIRSLANPLLYCISHAKFRKRCFDLLLMIFNNSKKQF